MPNFFSDLANTGIGGASIVPQTIASATTTNGTAFDFQNSDDAVDAVVLTGNCGDSTLTLDVKLQEAIEDTASLGNPLSSDWSDVAGQLYTWSAGTATATVAKISQLAGATAADNKFLIVSTRRRTKRFLRAVVTTAGGGTLSVPIAVAVLGRKRISGTGVGYVGYGGANT
jgi:hypothetical protein